ncbi:MAG TPA: hypothetical protein VG297_03750 [Bryobacteraceae bacterium]|nr:hypothetical protein [Bryobacteraceae bacterium]
MKAFRFRLEQALQWRGTELNIQKTRAAAANAKLAGIETALSRKQLELSSGAANAVRDATGFGLDSWAGFRRRLSTAISDLEVQILAARKNADLEAGRLIEARRKLRVLENLQSTAQERWKQEFEHELAAFADEAFVQGLRSRSRSKQ